MLTALADVAHPGDVVMSADAGAYSAPGGWPGIVTPDDPLPVVEEALRLYGVRWLALEAEHVMAALVPVLTGGARPDWLSEPVLVEPPPGRRCRRRERGGRGLDPARCRALSLSASTPTRDATHDRIPSVP